MAGFPNYDGSRYAGLGGLCVGYDDGGAQPKYLVNLGKGYHPHGHYDNILVRGPSARTTRAAS